MTYVTLAIHTVHNCVDDDITQVEQSDDKTVKLKNLHLDMSGTYTCEVSTEGIYETVQASARMTVVTLPRGGPHIQGDERYLTEMPMFGDVVSFNCTSLKSKPAAKLTFFINDRKVSGRHNVQLREHLIMNEDEKPALESAILSMKFQLKRHHAPHGRMRIRCQQ